jgi:predicted dienelactone hydrolase
MVVTPPASAAQPGSNGVTTIPGDWTDATRHRRISFIVHLPTNAPAPVIIFSHGLGGSRNGYAYLGRHWASNGFVSVHIQHSGSDVEILRGTRYPLESMKVAILDPKNTSDRPKDVSFALDELAKANVGVGPFQGMLDLKSVGVAGHSFGALTAQAVAGMSFALPTRRFADKRVSAVIALSPTAPRTQPEKRFGEVRIPVMHLTGTADESPVADTSPKDRRVPFDSIQGVPQVLVTLQGGDHMVFSGGEGPARDHSRDELHRGLILRGTTAFWNATLKSDKQAVEWLSGGGYAKELGTNAVLELKGWKAGK